jgi:hypothetical protein
MSIQAMVIGGSLPAIAYLGNAETGGSASSWTFTSQPLGTPKARRRIILGVATQFANSAVPTSVTIDGTATTLHGTVSQANGASFVDKVQFYSLLIPTGTTATVVVNASGTSTSSNVAIAIWAAYNLRNSAPTATSTSTGSPASLDLNVENKGIVAAMAHSAFSGSTYAWSGATSDFNLAASGSVYGRSGAHTAVTSAQTPLTLTCTYTGANAIRQAIALSWR